MVAEPSAAPRILPSIVEPLWSSSEPVEPVRRKRSSVRPRREQMELIWLRQPLRMRKTRTCRRSVSRQSRAADRNGALDDAEDANACSMTFSLHKVRV